MMHDPVREHERAIGAALARRHLRVALACSVFVVTMVGAAYAFVPLYNWFCRTTGFGGTPLVATAAPTAPIARKIVVRFDANVAPGLSWSFAPEQRAIELKLGETALVHYVASSNAKAETVGIASYNVTPPEAGGYFNKLECFCFTEQRLAAGERLEMGVAFFVDPALDKDPEFKTLHSITLSYTFFPVQKPAKPLADAGQAPAANLR
jgi:cytochrome c oxidase assembly protein subunit 11